MLVAYFRWLVASKCAGWPTLVAKRRAFGVCFDLTECSHWMHRVIVFRNIIARQVCEVIGVVDD